MNPESMAQKYKISLSDSLVLEFNANKSPRFLDCRLPDAFKFSLFDKAHGSFM